MKPAIERILLAEDNIGDYKNFINAVYRISSAIEVMWVDDGYTLMNMVQTNIRPNVIFLDIDMKYKNGLLALHEIRKEGHLKNVPVIMLSNSAYTISIELAYELGAIFFVQKPTSVERLTALLQEVFDSHYFASCVQPAREEFTIS